MTELVGTTEFIHFFILIGLLMASALIVIMAVMLRDTRRNLEKNQNAIIETQKQALTNHRLILNTQDQALSNHKRIITNEDQALKNHAIILSRIDEVKQILEKKP